MAQASHVFRGVPAVDKEVHIFGRSVNVPSKCR